VQVIYLGVCPLLFMCLVVFTEWRGTAIMWAFTGAYWGVVMIDWMGYRWGYNDEPRLWPTNLIRHKTHYDNAHDTWDLVMYSIWGSLTLVRPATLARSTCSVPRHGHNSAWQQRAATSDPSLVQSGGSRSPVRVPSTASVTGQWGRRWGGGGGDAVGGRGAVLVGTAAADRGGRVGPA
jgi:hypothetical protein